MYGNREYWHHTLFVSTLPPEAQDRFNELTEWVDGLHISTAGYLYDVDAATALRHETRSSAWIRIGAVEESGHLIPQHVTVLIDASLLSSTKYDVYRAGGVDRDNLYPAYSNLVFGNGLWSSYLPKESVMAQNGRVIAART
ncbi:hypothetical protein OIDMADRAFT_36351 [Oidiodendron maius Zn]|uniref:Uncharacterized protein n=1 Tax=Oidiodendron maius (strain Zn) TaxID=913774 RepID=A0A0C3GMK7_OIDMZ|nr:hypothetical protein OIDMADRAFT_36351 [Oidiodendron maius Zn]